MLDINKECCRKLLEQGYGAGDLSAVEAAVAARCRVHDPVFPDLQPGVDSLKQHILSLRTTFPDLTCSCDSMAADGDEVTVQWTCRGTQRDVFLGQPATNRGAVLGGHSLFRLADGKIVEMWSGWNLRTLLDQLGLSMTQQQSNKTLVTRFLDEVWNQRNPDKITEFVAEGCSRYSPNGLLRGPDGYRAEFDAYTTAFSDFRIHIDEMTCEADRVVVRFTATGTQDGPFRDMAPSGKRVSFIGVSLYHLGEGKIVEQYLTFDDFGLRRQLSV